MKVKKSELDKINKIVSILESKEIEDYAFTDTQLEFSFTHKGFKEHCRLYGFTLLTLSDLIDSVLNSPETYFRTKSELHELP